MLNDPNNEFPPSYVQYFGKALPARVTIEVVQGLLGFSQRELQILMGKKMLKPSGKPRVNSTKHFSTAYIMRLASDEKWINKATEICQAASNKRSDDAVKRRVECA